MHVYEIPNNAADGFVHVHVRGPFLYVGLPSYDISLHQPGREGAHSKSQLLLHISGAAGDTATADSE